MECVLTDQPCTGGSCPFWVHGECLIGDIDLRGRDDVTRWLSSLRREIAAADSGAAELHHVLNQAEE